LWAAHGTLVSYKSVLGKDENRNSVEVSRHLTSERLVSRYTGDAGQQIDSVWRTAQLNQLVGFSEIRFLEADIRETELIQKIDKLGCIFARGSNQYVQISRVTRSTVKGEAVRPPRPRNQFRGSLVIRETLSSRCSGAWFSSSTRIRNLSLPVRFL